jgi:hypothetical protein
MWYVGRNKGKGERKKIAKKENEGHIVKGRREV